MFAGRRPGFLWLAEGQFVPPFLRKSLVCQVVMKFLEVGGIGGSLVDGALELVGGFLGCLPVLDELCRHAFQVQGIG